MSKTQFLLILSILLAACGQVQVRAVTPPTQPPLVATTPALASAPTQTSAPSITPTYTATPAPTASPTATVTPTSTPHPMSIAALRARSYPGSDITIVQELDAGANYHRYYAFYLSDGLKIYALLTVPYGDPPPGGWPAIVFNHGYIPPRQYRTTERYIAYVDNLARRGYIVFRIDYRGNDRSEGEAAGAYGDPGYTIDVLNAVASIKRYPQANPQKIGMWGHSMGGFLTLRAMVVSPDIKAGVIWSGVVGSYPDLLYHWRHAGSGPTPTPPPEGRGWRNRWIAEYGTPEENPGFWNAVSANSYLVDLSGPLQLDASPADPEVPFAFSETLDQQAQAAGKVVELNGFPSNDHNLAQSFSAAMADTLRFYEKYLR